MSDQGVDLGIEGIEHAVEIGRGGFGVVFRATQTAFDRTVAVKVLTVDDVSSDAMARFQRELKAIGTLSGHPHIVMVHAHGSTAGGQPYLLMEFCERGALGTALRRHGPMRWNEATTVGVEIAGALETAHRAGVLHRDVKPDNILSDSYGTPKLGDFGIARVSTQNLTTKTGALTGSPAHVSPELLAGGAPSASSDVYSLASTAHALISGRGPFNRDDESSVLPLLHRVLNEPPPDLRQWGLPQPLWDVIAKGLAKTPEERYVSALEFGTALREARLSLGLEGGNLRVSGLDGVPSPITPAAPPVADSTVTGSQASAPTPDRPQAFVTPTPSAQEPAPTPQPAPTPPSTPAPPPVTFAAPPTGVSSGGPGGSGSSSKTLAIVLAVIAAVAVIGIGALVLTSGGGDGNTAQTSSSTTTTGEVNPPPTSQPTTTPTTAAPGYDLDAALLMLDDLPTAYTLADPTVVSAIDPSFGFCNQRIDISRIAESTTAEYWAGNRGPFVISIAMAFTDEPAASAYLAAADQTSSCGNWIDGTGSEQEVLELSYFPPVDEARAYLQTQFDGDTPIVEAEFSFYREREVVVVVGFLSAPPIDTTLSDAIAGRQVDLILDAVP